MIYAITALGIRLSEGYNLTPGVLFDLLAIRRQASGEKPKEEDYEC